MNYLAPCVRSSCISLRTKILASCAEPTALSTTTRTPNWADKGNCHGCSSLAWASNWLANPDPAHQVNRRHVQSHHVGAYWCYEVCKQNSTSKRQPSVNVAAQVRSLAKTAGLVPTGCWWNSSRTGSRPRSASSKSFFELAELSATLRPRGSQASR